MPLQPLEAGDGRPLEQVAYEAYADDAGWASVHGEPLPAWRDQRPEIARHWCAAVQAVLAELHPGPPL
jgi:hypothetical protein